MTTLFGYIGQFIMKVDFLGVGAILPVFGLMLGISIAVSGGKTINFMISLLMMTFISATVIFVTTKDGIYYLGFALALLVTIFLPDNTIEGIFGVPKA